MLEINKEKKVILKGVLVKYYCPYLDKVLTKTIRPDWDMSCDSGSCDICGEHGFIEVDFKCKCGTLHTLQLKKW